MKRSGATIRKSRKHNDSNVLVLPSRFMTQEDASAALKVWLETEFEGGRHQRRVEQIDTQTPAGSK